jgi:hypothetical protein
VQSQPLQTLQHLFGFNVLATEPNHQRHFVMLVLCEVVGLRSELDEVSFHALIVTFLFSVLGDKVLGIVEKGFRVDFLFFVELLFLLGLILLDATAAMGQNRDLFGRELVGYGVSEIGFKVKFLFSINFGRLCGLAMGQYSLVHVEVEQRVKWCDFEQNPVKI